MNEDLLIDILQELCVLLDDMRKAYGENSFAVDRVQTVIDSTGEKLCDAINERKAGI